MGDVTTGKQEWVYSDLRSQLEGGRRLPGERLVITQLAQEFGVSPIPVREAIRRLEAEGWVVYRPQFGAEVAGLTREAWASAAEVLAVIEGQATALAAPRLDAADIASLRELNAQMAATVTNGELARFMELNRSFHAVIRGRCENGWLTRMIDEMQPRFDALGPGTVQPRTRHAISEHAELVDLIEQRAAPERIEAAARQHKLRTIEPYL